MFKLLTLLDPVRDPLTGTVLHKPGDRITWDRAQAVIKRCDLNQLRTREFLIVVS